MSRVRNRSRTDSNLAVQGSILILIVLVGLVIAYKANQGLPFAPAYHLKVELPGASNLGPGDEVRIGGSRIGFVDKLTPKTVIGPEGPHAIAVASVKLKRRFKPLPRDTKVLVRFASPVGLKFLELKPGTSHKTFADGATIPLANAGEPVEFDQFFALYDKPTRRNTREALTGWGDALAGRGRDLNVAIGALRPLLGSLTKVARGLVKPSTRLRDLFPQLELTSRQLLPVSDLQARMYEDTTTTLHALNEHPRALTAMVDKTPSTQASGIRSFKGQSPFLDDYTSVSADMRPLVTSLERWLPAINSMMRTGTPSFAQSTRTSELSKPMYTALDKLVADPSTLLGLKRLDELTVTANPLLAYLAPFQTVCNYLNYALASESDIISGQTSDGTGFLNLLATTNGTQVDRLDDYPAERPADVPQNEDPVTATDALGQPMEVMHTQFMTPAVDSRGRADCGAGQWGYPAGPLATDRRYAPSNDPDKLGGNYIVTDPNTPGLSGPTYTGLPGLQEVP